MPIKTEKLDNQPIIIATYIGHVTAGDVEQMYTETANLLAGTTGKYYRINDVQDSDTTFPEFVKISSSITEDGPYRTGDPNLQAIFVGTNQWIKNVNNLTKKQKNLTLLTFRTFQKAMEYIENDMSPD